MPSIRIRPTLGFSSAAIMFKTVLLPEPDGPSSATNSPRLTLNVTLRTASIWPAPSWNVLPNPSLAIRGGSPDPTAVMPLAPSCSYLGKAQLPRKGFARRLDEARRYDLGDRQRF